MHDKVYDLTEFKATHPGGPKILEKNSGSDCSALFEKFKHGDHARSMMDKYCIGRWQEYSYTMDRIR